jgi:hypothetical protein
MLEAYVGSWGPRKMSEVSDRVGFGSVFVGGDGMNRQKELNL